MSPFSTRKKDEDKVKDGEKAKILESLPPLLQALYQGAMQFGVPALIAGFLVWQLAVGITASLATLTSKIEVHASASEAHYTVISGKEDAQTSLGQMQVLLLEKVCLRISKTDAERQDCVLLAPTQRPVK